MLKNNDLQFEDFDNFYPADKAYCDAYMEEIRVRAANLAFPHIHKVFTLIKQAAKSGKFEINYRGGDWSGTDAKNYTEYFLINAGYKAKTPDGIPWILNISWEREKN